MVKNLKRYRKQVEREQGKIEAMKYPLLSLTDYLALWKLPICLEN